MDWLTLSLFLYCMVAAFALFMTMLEEQTKRDRNLPERVLGYLACSLWPVTLIAVVYLHSSRTQGLHRNR